MASITLEHVHKTYRDRRRIVRAVEDFTLHVDDRECVVIVGPSGCGKTTTLRMIAGLEHVNEGTIRIDGRVVNDVPPKDRDVAMVFQNYALYPHMTAYKNMAFPLKMRRMPRAAIQAKVHEVASMLGIEHLLDRKPRDLSGGEQQRVAVGRAIVRSPRVFLFDEPLSNLDAGLRLRMRTELKALHASLGATVIYVTHDQEEAMVLGHRLVVMNDGVIQQCGRPMDVYRTPANRFTAQFIGTPPMNFITGQLEGVNGTLVFTGGGATIPLPPALSPRCAARGPTRAVLGVRPDDLDLDECHDRDAEPARARPRGHAPPADAPDWSATVTSVDPLGDRTHVHLTTPTGDALVARCAGTVAFAPRRRVRVRVAANRLHLFDPDERGRRMGGSG